MGGQQTRDDKRGQISSTLLPLLGRLGVEPLLWLKITSNIEAGSIVGTETSIKAALPLLKRRRASGVRLPDN